MSELITQFNDTGPCEIDISKTVAAWNERFAILQYRSQFRLVARSKELPEETELKVVISATHAGQLIDQVSLTWKPDGFFKQASAWRRDGDHKEKESNDAH